MKLEGSVQKITVRGNIKILEMDNSGCLVLIKRDRFKTGRVGDRLSLEGFYAKLQEINRTVFWSTRVKRLS